MSFSDLDIESKLDLSNPKNIPKYIYDFCKKNYEHPFGFFVSTFFATIIIFVFLNNFGVFQQDRIYLNQYLVFALVLFVCFYLIFQWAKYPINSLNKIGIFLAISNRYNNNEAKEFVKQVHFELEKMLSQTKYGTMFNVVSLTEYKSQKIIKGFQTFKRGYIQNKSFLKRGLHIKNSRWHLLLFGDLKKGGRENGEVHYKLDLDYAINHRPIPAPISDWMGVDFKEFLNSQIWIAQAAQDQIALDNFTQNIRENILYSLGVSAYVSGMINIAREFHEELLNFISERGGKPKAIERLIYKSIDYLARENHMLGNFYYEKQDSIDLAISYQEKAIKYKPNLYYAHLNLASHYYFKKNILKVMFHLGKAEKYQQDPSWKISKGFILSDQESKDGSFI
jgi:hypothetical protein